MMSFVQPQKLGEVSLRIGRDYETEREREEVCGYLVQKQKQQDYRSSLGSDILLHATFEAC